MNNDIKDLIDYYQRKANTLTNMLEKTKGKDKTPLVSKLMTKEHCYKGFITELSKLK